MRLLVIMMTRPAGALSTRGRDEQQRTGCCTNADVAAAGSSSPGPAALSLGFWRAIGTFRDGYVQLRSAQEGGGGCRDPVGVSMDAFSGFRSSSIKECAEG
jgi:hypothetical protein